MQVKIAQNLNINAIHERYVYDKAGVLFHVRFTVVGVNGILQPQVISAEPVIAQSQAVSTVRKTQNRYKASATSTVFLANPKPAQSTPVAPRAFFSDIVSPFISLDFLMSQPIRAPSLN